MTAPRPAQKEPYGVAVEVFEEVWLRGCTATGGGPFCDGSHEIL